MFTTQIYTAEDLQQNKTLQKQFLDVMLSKNKNMGVASDKRNTLAEFKRLIENNGKFVECYIAVYEEDKFVGFKFIKRLNNGVTNAVCFTSVNFAYQNLLNWSKPHPWKSALDAAGKYIVENHIYDVYIMQPDRPAIQKAWKSGKDIFRYCSEWYDDETQSHKWHRFVEYVLEPGQRPNSDYIYSLVMNKTPQEVPIVIRRLTLKNKYRPDWDKVKHWWIEG